MKRSILPVTVLLCLAAARPALGWDPYDDLDVVATPPAWTPEAAPVAPPPGIYLVTDTYAGDSITRNGALTTYSTQTVHESTGSYARVLESVGTGDSSAYDGAAFNGRAALTDGRGVAGTYYENYIQVGGGFVAVSIVFFQDDSELARGSTAVQPQPTAAPPASPAPTPFAPPAVVTPVPAAPTAPPPVIRPSTPLPDRDIEVLRGRRTTLSFAGPDVLRWRYRSGECVALGAISGGPSDPFVARWDRLAPIGSSWIVRFVVDYADGTSHELLVRVTVRAPGLVE